MTRISFILAASQNGVIGVDNNLPWHLPADLQYFRRMTMGKPVIMGRKTFEGIGKPLSGRHNIVLTRDRTYGAPGCTVVHSPQEALRAAGDVPEVMIIGGSEIYRLFLPVADRIYLTCVAVTIAEGDATMPPLQMEEWREISRDYHPADERHPFPFEWIVLDRIP